MRHYREKNIELNLNWNSGKINSYLYSYLRPVKSQNIYLPNTQDHTTRHTTLYNVEYATLVDTTAAYGLLTRTRLMNNAGRTIK